MWVGTNFEGIYPFVPGHEWSGHITEVGSEVKKFKVGDRVTGDNFIACGKCEICKTSGDYYFCPDHQAYGWTPEYPGGIAEYHWSPEERLFKIPDSMDDELGALVEVVSVAYHAIWARSEGIGPHDRVAIIGTGPVGQIAAAISKIAGAQVIAIEPEPHRAEMAKKMGADMVIDPSVGDPVKDIMDLTGGLGVTRIIECSGSIGGIALTVDIISVNGVIVLTGQSIGTKIPIEIGKTIWKHAKIVGSCGSPYFFQQTIDFMAKGLVDFKKLITHRFPLGDALEAFKLGDSATAGKILIYPDPSKMPS